MIKCYTVIIFQYIIDIEYLMNFSKQTLYYKLTVREKKKIVISKTVFLYP